MTTATHKQWAALIKLDIRIFHNNMTSQPPATPKQWPALVKLDKDEHNAETHVPLFQVMLQYFTDDPRRFWCCVYLMLMLCVPLTSLARRFYA